MIFYDPSVIKKIQSELEPLIKQGKEVITARLVTPYPPVISAETKNRVGASLNILNRNLKKKLIFTAIIKSTIINSKLCVVIIDKNNNKKRK